LRFLAMSIRQFFFAISATDSFSLITLVTTSSPAMAMEDRRILEFCYAVWKRMLLCTHGPDLYLSALM
jgi:hypothetical protein